MNEIAERIKSMAGRLQAAGRLIERKGKKLRCGKCGKQVKRFTISEPGVVITVDELDPEEPPNRVIPMADWDEETDDIEGLVSRMIMILDCLCWPERGYVELAMLPISDLADCDTGEEATNICRERLRITFRWCQEAIAGPLDQKRG